MSAALVLSPWWGYLELVSLPGTDTEGNPIGPHVECWDGGKYVLVIAETLRPLSTLAARTLGRKPGDLVWDAAQKLAWEREPILGLRLGHPYDLEVQSDADEIFYVNPYPKRR